MSLPKKVKTGEPVLCRVCGVVVPRRKDYCPTVCEACKKFFTRNCRRPGELMCSSGNFDCSIESKSRRFCTGCRFNKCLAVGMRCRLGKKSRKKSNDVSGDSSFGSDNVVTKVTDLILNDNSAFDASGMEMEIDTDSTLSPESFSPESAETKVSTRTKPVVINDLNDYDDDDDDNTALLVDDESIVPLIKTPIVFDGNMAERTLRNAVQGFTRLHGLEYLDLKCYNGFVDSAEKFWLMASKHLHDAVETGFSYGRHLAECEHLGEADLNLLMCDFLMPMSGVYMALPSTLGAKCFGISDVLMPTVLRLYPEFHETNDAALELAAELSLWNAELAECALFFSFIFFSGHSCSNKAFIFRIRQRLLLAFNLYCSAKLKRSSTSVAVTVAESQRHFRKSLQLSRNSDKCLERTVEMMAKRSPNFTVSNPLFSQVFFTPPAKSRLGTLFPTVEGNNN